MNTKSQKKENKGGGVVRNVSWFQLHFLKSLHVLYVRMTESTFLHAISSEGVL